MSVFLKLWDGLTTILVTAIVILAILLVGVRLVGFQVFTVLSGSMEPTYPTGSLLYVRAVDPANLRGGDVITFAMDNGAVATHRISRVLDAGGELQFVTKGDANEAEDGAPVAAVDVIGKPLFAIPKLGYLANFIQYPPGKYLAVAVCAAILLLAFLPDLFRKETE